MSRNEARFPTWLIPVTILTVGVGALIYLAYRYFVYPGDVILNQYKTILKDMYAEIKEFLDENQQLEPPIYGLTAGQEAIINAKNDAAERLRPQVEEILKNRNLNVNAWVETAIIGIIVAVAAPSVVKALVDLYKAWRSENPEASSNIQSGRGHAHYIMELALNEYAELGQLNVASGFLANIQSYYSTYTDPSLTTGINYYQALIPTLTPGTTAWIVANSMLTYMQYEISATTGIMATLWTWWYPPLL